MKQKLTLYFTCILFKINEGTDETKGLLRNNTVCLKNNCCGFQCTNGNLGNQTRVGLIVK